MQYTHYTNETRFFMPPYKEHLEQGTLHKATNQNKLLMELFVSNVTLFRMCNSLVSKRNKTRCFFVTELGLYFLLKNCFNV